MLILNLLYNLFIGPLELFFEVIYAFSYRVIGNPGLAIIFLSLAMNFLVLPLYRRADALQEEERERAIRMKPWTDHIKKTFKGDERFMMLQTYNRQNNYKPTDALRGSISLLLEIPFFIAAFHFLSNLQLLHGVSFGPLSDLGAPDALIHLGGTSINFLPILMTIINVVSAAIYMKGMPLSNKIQMYGIAAVFLVLLYGSASGLVFYWTLNNLFSLIKNIFYKLKNPKKVLAALSSIMGVVVPVVFLLAHIEPSARRIAFLILVFVILQIPLALYFRKESSKHRVVIPDATPSDERAFFVGCLFLALMLGLFIPLSVIQASPSEFVDFANYQSPLWAVLESFALALGTFVIWFGVFYRLATPKGKTIFGVVLLALAGTAIVNYLFFGTSYGTLSSQLRFETTPDISRAGAIINLIVLLAVSTVLLGVWKLKKSAVKIAYSCMCVAVLIMSVFGAWNIQSTLEKAKISVEKSRGSNASITFSSEGNNVAVIMLDRAIAYYIPYLLSENPALKDAFAGFTYYPNTISYGIYTNTGAPALFGGSDYRPASMNERNTLSLREKHNEALKVMPTLFDQNNYSVTFFDPTYANYAWIPDVSIFDDIPKAKTYITMDGSFEAKEISKLKKENVADGHDATKANTDSMDYSDRVRNYFCYSVFKVSPLLLQPLLYHEGDYNSTSMLVYGSDDLSESTQEVVGSYTEQVRTNSSVGVGFDETFMNSYAVLQALPDITRITKNETNNFFIMTNDTTHEPMLLKEPEYVPSFYVDNTEYDLKHRWRASLNGEEMEFPEENGDSGLSKLMHYQVNMASLQQLANWFEYLRDNNAYDNTRIIIVSDHGRRNLGLDDSFLSDADGNNKDADEIDLLAFNCLLMVKDFDSHEFTIDDSFMTNADTPVLALAGLVEKPVNPFTGNSLDSSYKHEPEQYVLYSRDWDITKNNKNTFFPGYWYSVHDNALDASNWQYLGNY